MATRSAKGFDSSYQPHQPEQPSQPQAARQSQPNDDGVTGGLSAVLTHEAQSTANHLAVAEKFSGDTAKALAHKAHDISSCQHFRRTFQTELARLQQEQPPQEWGAFDFSGLEAVITEAKKPSLPPASINFLPPSA